MKVITTIKDVRAEIKKLKADGKSIGLVPTMGFIHGGHLSLVRASACGCDVTVVSIFVNPTQFGENEDFHLYPRDINRDLDILRRENADIVFAPSDVEMYGEYTSCMTTVAVEELSRKLEGRFRPGHFDGVCTVVAKLFNIIAPDSAYFGWKDAQQLIIIKRMSEDLNIPIKIKGCPIVREADGLAASSRNIYIKKDQRHGALSLFRSLKLMQKLHDGEKVRDASALLEKGRTLIKETPDVELQYLEIVDTEYLDSVSVVEGNVLAAGAIKVGQVRLIDNILLA